MKTLRDGLKSREFYRANDLVSSKNKLEGKRNKREESHRLRFKRHMGQVQNAALVWLLFQRNRLKQRNHI